MQKAASTPKKSWHFQVVDMASGSKPGGVNERAASKVR